MTSGTIRNSSQLARVIRQDVLRMAYQAKSAHVGSALSIADIVSVLYANVLKYDVKNQNSKVRDRFVLSKGHACSAVYSVLTQVGFFDRNALDEYGKNGAMLMQHISHHVPGVEFSTGSLGHGLGFGVGMALAAKQNGNRFRTFVLISDGELNEGSTWEAIMFAAHHRLSDLTLIIDKNNLQSLETTQKTLNLDPLNKKFEAFDWYVDEVDGHSHKEMLSAFQKRQAESNKPQVVICNTIKGFGVSFMENAVPWHYKSPDKNELDQALRNLRDHH
jgi:transketolase